MFGSVRQSHFEGCIHLINNFLFPDETAESNVSGQSGRSDIFSILFKFDDDGISGIWCQVHIEVDSISTFHAELGEDFFSCADVKAFWILIKVVRYSLLVAEVADVSGYFINIIYECLDGCVRGRKPCLLITDFVGQSTEFILCLVYGTLDWFTCGREVDCKNAIVNVTLEIRGYVNQFGSKGAHSNVLSETFDFQVHIFV